MSSQQMLKSDRKGTFCGSCWILLICLAGVRWPVGHSILGDLREERNERRAGLHDHGRGDQEQGRTPGTLGPHGASQDRVNPGSAEGQLRLLLKVFVAEEKKMFVYHLEDVLKGFALNKITRKMKKSGNDVISRWSNATTTTRNVLKEKKHLKPRSSSSHPYFQNRHRVKRNSRFLSP